MATGTSEPSARSLVPVAGWEDRAWIARAATRVALRQLFHLPVLCPPGASRAVHLDSQALFFYFSPGSIRSDAALLIDVPSRRAEGTFLRWVRSGGALDRQVGLRLAWWIYNELSWRPGSIVMSAMVPDVLGIDAFAHDLDAYPEAFGCSLVDPEWEQLLCTPPPALWELESFLSAHDS